MGTEDLLDEITSVSVGAHIVSRRRGFFNEVMRLPNPMGPSGGKSQGGEIKYSGLAFAIFHKRLLDRCWKSNSALSNEQRSECSVAAFRPS